MAVFRDWTPAGFKHLKANGKKRRPVGTLSEANQTQWMFKFTHPGDGSAAQVAVVDVVKGETLRQRTIDAAEVKARNWGEDNPDGDPVDSSKDLQGNPVELLSLYEMRKPAPAIRRATYGRSQPLPQRRTLSWSSACRGSRTATKRAVGLKMAWKLLSSLVGV